jgi:hypothetical protein
VQFIVGRQELRIGDERVVGISDWTNTSRTWDGFHIRMGNVNQLNLFSTSVVTIHPTSLDTHGAGLTFHGVHAKLTTYVPHTTIEPFVLVHALPRVASQQGVVGSQTEATFGSYYETKLPLGFDSSGTGDLQRGSYSNDSIHAGAAIVRGGYGTKCLPWQPHLEAEYNYATGDPHTNPHRIGTYDQQYPSDHMHSAWSTCSASRTSSSVGGGFKSDDIGSEFDASAKYIYHKSFVTNIGVGHSFQAS